MRELAVSMAGHDRGEVYAVLREEDGWVFLVNGKNRTLDAPKKKNLRHVQRIRRLPDEAARVLGAAVRDEDVVYALRLYGAAVRAQSAEAD